MEETKPLPKQKGRRGAGTVSLGGSVLSRYGGAVRSFEGGKSSVAPRASKDSSILQSSPESSKAGENKAISKMPENMDELVKINKNTEKSYKVTNKTILKILKVLLQIEKLVEKSEKKKKKKDLSTLERLMERLKKYSPENLLKSGKEKLKEKSVSVVNRGLDKIGVKTRLDKLDERDKLLKLQKKSGLDKSNIKSKPYVDRVSTKGPGETFASDKKSITKIASDRSVLGRVMPSVLKSLGSSVGAIIPILLKVLFAVLIIAAAAGLGYMLYKLLIEPMLDKQQKAIQDEVLGKATTQGQDTVTDTGEEVYEKTSMVPHPDGQGGVVPQKTYVTKQQMEQELSALPEEEREEARTNYVRARSVTNIATGESTGTKQGVSIEELNAAAKAETELSPREKALKKFSDEIGTFEGDFKQELSRIAAAIKKGGAIGGAAADVLGMDGTNALFEALVEKQKMFVDRLKDNKELTEQDKIALTENSAVFKGTFMNGVDSPVYPTVDTVGFGVTLPSGKNINLKSSNMFGVASAGYNWLVGDDIDEYTENEKDNIPTINRKLYGTEDDGGLTSRAANQKYVASQTKKPQASPAPTPVAPAQPQMSGTELETRALQEKTQKPNVQTPSPQVQTSQKPIVINNNNSSVNASMPGGGGGGPQYASATPPEASPMEPSLMGRDEGRSASLGGNSS